MDEIGQSGYESMSFSFDVPDWARKDYIIRFFYLFSKMEFALKRAGFTMKGRKLNNQWAAQADWKSFAQSLGDDFFMRAQSVETQILFKNPPHLQVIDNKNALSWSKQDAPKDCKKLFDVVKTVRNNLFHGGKYPLGPISEPGRDQELILACISVLELALNTNRAVEHWFEDDKHEDSHQIDRSRHVR